MILVATEGRVEAEDRSLELSHLLKSSRHWAAFGGAAWNEARPVPW